MRNDRRSKKVSEEPTKEQNKSVLITLKKKNVTRQHQQPNFSCQPLANQKILHHYYYVKRIHVRVSGKSWLRLER